MFDAALIEIREYARFNLPLRYLNIIQEINKDKKKLKLSKTENIFKIKQMVELKETFNFHPLTTSCVLFCDPLHVISVAVMVVWGAVKVEEAIWNKPN
jgi:hypothetical protein